VGRRFWLEFRALAANDGLEEPFLGPMHIEASVPRPSAPRAHVFQLRSKAVSLRNAARAWGFDDPPQTAGRLEVLRSAGEKPSERKETIPARKPLIWSRGCGFGY